MKISKKKLKTIIPIVIIAVICVGLYVKFVRPKNENPINSNVSADISEITSLKFSGQPYAVVNNNNPRFESTQITAKSFEKYGELDKLGRCTAAVSSIGKDLMPTEKRGDIGMVKPTGWQIAKYDGVDGKYLYNRCHLIGFQLTGENANKQNLITGTRYMNVEGMLPFENMVADYIKETGNHCMYRVTPIFVEDELVARGVTMEAQSVEDGGEGIKFYVYCFNNQPDIEINYKTGASKPVKSQKTENKNDDTNKKYILNISSKKFHLPSCSAVKDVKPNNKKEVNAKRSELIDQGYSPCNGCKP